MIKQKWIQILTCVVMEAGGIGALSLGISVSQRVRIAGCQLVGFLIGLFTHLGPRDLDANSLLIVNYDSRYSDGLQDIDNVPNGFRENGHLTEHPQGLKISANDPKSRMNQT